MGIIINALAIVFGGLFGNKLQKSNSTQNDTVLGIGIIIVSLVSFIENMYNVEGGKISSSSLILILFAFLIGNKIGESLHIEDWLSNLGKTSNNSFNAFIDTTLFFSVGGLQISGPIALAVKASDFSIMERYFNKKNLIFTELLKANPHIYIRKEHPLAHCSSITLEDLALYPYVSYEQGEHNNSFLLKKL